MTKTPTKPEYNIIEVSASTAFSSSRDYGSHPISLTQTGELELPELIAQPFPDCIPPVSEWRKWARHQQDKQSEAWIHYASDVKSASLLRDPEVLVNTGAKFTTELNCSSFEDDPLSVALASLWRKRCIGRYWQDKGIQVAVDMNVAGWTRDFVLDGVPSTHSLFAIRYMKNDLSGEAAGDHLRVSGGQVLSQLLCKAISWFTSTNGKYLLVSRQLHLKFSILSDIDRFYRTDQITRKR